VSFLLPRHLKDLMADQTRCEALIKEEPGPLDLRTSRQRMTQDHHQGMQSLVSSFAQFSVSSFTVGTESGNCSQMPSQPPHITILSAAGRPSAEHDRNACEHQTLRTPKHAAHGMPVMFHGRPAVSFRLMQHWSSGCACNDSG